jgi:hypothetical protein
MSNLSDAELLEWCKQHGFSVKMAALLSVWDPDLDELEEWKIEENDREFVVNDDIYEVLTSAEYDLAEEQTMQDIKDYLTEDVPDALLEYIDWKSFFYRNPVGIEDVLSEGDSVQFNNEWYYYGVI